jgi:hypothetical protein
MNFSKRSLLATGFGAAAGLALGGLPAFAQDEGGKAKTIPHRMAKTTKMFKAPDFYPNAMAAGENGLWLGQQTVRGKTAEAAHIPSQTGPERAWLVDWNGKLQKTFEYDYINTSGLAYGGGYVWAIGNGVRQIDMKGNVTKREIPLGGGSSHGGKWRDGKLWIIANRLAGIERVDIKNWAVDYEMPIQHDTPLTLRWHDMAFDNDGNIWLVTGNDSKNYAQGKAGLAKYDGKTGQVLELVSFVPGSGDPHGLEFHNGKLIACDAGHHPGWPDKDGPTAGWIFSIDFI